MRLLLDTHIFIWFCGNDSKLSRTAADLIGDPTNDAFLSPIVMWEIAIKVGSGKLTLLRPYEEFVREGQRAYSFIPLPIELRHISRLLTLPLSTHRDPFDRLLVSQALADGMTLVSADERLDEYAVPRAF
jgi:PIN domain nuclease of toxin-antitoxin system